MTQFAINRVKIPREYCKNMRVPDFVLKCVGYVAQYHTSDALSDDFDLEGTGFFVSVPVKPRPANSWFFFVTAKHTIKDLRYADTWFLVNKKGGGIKRLESGNRWYFHPTDPTTDVAVMPFNIDPVDDILNLPLEMFLTSELMKSRNIGIGDDVFFPGLFTFAPGTKTGHMPIVRHGNIAMLPKEEIQVDSGFSHVYLIEARSIGGISGSPVFASETTYLRVENEKSGEENVLSGLGSRFYLLGMARAHWDIKESELNKYTAIQDQQRGVNMGVAMVTPAYKIWETINGPELTALREEAEVRIRAEISPTEDAV